ncbi:unnamed protein product [Caenorhabditis auriculariae]|uniref:Uncharacterized protein n=1 Tax=Caenorhabditis auriculariae TaxID=2777116 RepID=A0A8S1HMM3_9PELO|nr:unnamed protein product [Caenorhabditis auriculariae]
MMGPPRKMPSRLSASRIPSSDKAERSSSAPPSDAVSTKTLNKAKERLEYMIDNWKRKSVLENIDRLLLEQLMATEALFFVPFCAISSALMHHFFLPLPLSTTS